MNRSPFDHLPRCGAKTRSGHPCKRPATKKGRCKLHGGAIGSGAPYGNVNALKHGRYSRDALDRQRLLQRFLRDARRFLDGLLSRGN